MTRDTIRSLAAVAVVVAASTGYAEEAAEMKPPAVTAHSVVGAEDATASTAPTVFSKEDLIAQSRLPRMRKLYKEWGSPLFSSREKVVNAVLADAARDHMTGVLVAFAGTRREEHSGIGAVYNVVDAYSVKLVEPTPENVADSIRHIGHEGPQETDVALRFAVEQRQTDVAPALLAYIKDFNVGNIDQRAVHAYGAILEQGAVPELTKVLRFHSNESARVAAGNELAKLGASGVVQDALASERSDAVKRELQHALLR